MIEYIVKLLSKISPEAATIIVAALPITELRGSIPLAVLHYEFGWVKAVSLSVFGNMLPIPFWLLFLNYVQGKLMRFTILNKFFTWLFERTRKKGQMIEKYETLGLMIFVGIPLPMTGAWSGAIAAFIFGVKFRHAMVAIFLGVLVAAAIVAALTLLGWIGAIIAGIALFGLAVVTVMEVFKHEKQ
jgi:uncharacterized membrane protein